jgi:hypothetical protein
VKIGQRRITEMNMKGSDLRGSALLCAAGYAEHGDGACENGFHNYIFFHFLFFCTKGTGNYRANV